MRHRVWSLMVDNARVSRSVGIGQGVVVVARPVGRARGDQIVADPEKAVDHQGGQAVLPALASTSSASNRRSKRMVEQDHANTRWSAIVAGISVSLDGYVTDQVRMSETDARNQDQPA